MANVFSPVNTKIDFTKQEVEILAFWKSHKIFEKSLADNHKPLFVFYEGPPTANGYPGIHHVISRVFKDVIPRYKTMKGFHVPRKGGWDTHGLPVELEVEKELGFTSKAQIENYGIDRFNARCRQSVFRYLKEWNAFTDRIAFWLDLEHAYITMSNDYIESCWWAISKLWQQDLVYRGYKTAAHCPRCGTSLSSHEVAQGYEENTIDPSVYIMFRLTGKSVSEILPDPVGEGAVYLLAWTTTPWTLPGNTALAIDPGASYTMVDNGKQMIIAATARLEAAGLGQYPMVAEFSGAQLEGLTYEPLYNPHDWSTERLRFKKGTTELEAQPEVADLSYPVIAGDFVTMDEGTGIVHVAPAFGEVDFEAGRRQGLDFIQHVDLGGIITGSYPFTGKFVKQADSSIIQDLEQRGHMLKHTTISHTYPFCWRCGTPLLYYVKQSWYIRTTARRDRLISLNETINWYPEHIKRGRFGDWLENNVDWAFSRERYWGTPLPVWHCEACNTDHCIGSIGELETRPGFSGFKEPLDLHRPYVDEITFTCECGGTMQRVPEVIDCWFDSGNMPIAQYHYPFENSTLLSDGRFPADFIAEAIDQTRGWFYSLHAISTLLFDQVAYKNVICLGHILDEKGEKMSKSRNNVIQTNVIIDQYGADAMRWYLYTASPPGQPRRFSRNLVGEVMRQFMLPLWNVYSFFTTYANIDAFDPACQPESDTLSELDRWILSELNDLIMKVDRDLENFDPTSAGRRIEEFVSGLSNWYVRRSRRRFWKSENDEDKLAAYQTLYSCLESLARLIAPFMPFMAEALYQNLVRSVRPDAPESVHLAEFPSGKPELIDPELASSVQLAIRLASLGRAARSQAGIKVRQPLPVMLVFLPDEKDRARVESISRQLAEELNVKSIEVSHGQADLSNFACASDNNYRVAISLKITPELEAEGLAREIVRRIQTLRREAGFDIADHIITFFESDDFTGSVMKLYEDYIKKETLSLEIKTGIPEDAFKGSYTLEGHALTLGLKR